MVAHVAMNMAAVSNRGQAQRQPWKEQKRRRPLTSAEALTSDGANVALQRVLRAQGVFHGSRQSPRDRAVRRELEARLLPSILQSPRAANSGRRPGTSDSIFTDSNSTTVPGIAMEQRLMEGDDFHQLYAKQVEAREQAEGGEGIFLDRDTANEWDPVHLAVAGCSIFGDLISNWKTKFRRAQEGLVHIAGDLPVDRDGLEGKLDMLSNILTLDLERCEMLSKVPESRLGFFRLQLTSCVPLVVCDPTAVSSVHMQSERVARNDLQVIRMDLYPGDVRRVSFNASSAEFRGALLSDQLAAKASERGAFARLVAELRSREVEARSLVAVLNDMLRDSVNDLPARPAPHVGEASNGAKVRSRLEMLASTQRTSLARLLEATEALARLAAPLVPSLAHAIDRISLLCVREVDRLVARSHDDYEGLLRLWAKVETEHSAALEQTGSQEDLAGVTEPNTSMSKTKRELARQELVSASLLAENAAMKKKLEEEVLASATLRTRVRELQSALSEGQLHRQPGTTWPGVAHDFEPAKSGVHAAATEACSAVHTAVEGQPVPTYTVHCSSQTDTEHFFNDGASFAEELSAADFDRHLHVAGRLIAMLQNYEWNNTTRSYLLREGSSRSTSMFELDGPPVPRGGLDAVSLRSMRLWTVEHLKLKVQLVERTACIAQHEEEVRQLDALAKEGVESWASMRPVVQRGRRSADTAELDPSQTTIEPGELWSKLRSVVAEEALLPRVIELEEALGLMAPATAQLLHRSKTHQSVHSSEGAFWRRVVHMAVEKTSGNAGYLTRIEKSTKKSMTTRTGLDEIFEEIHAVFKLLMARNGQQAAGQHGPDLLHAAIQTRCLEKSGSLGGVEHETVSFCCGLINNCNDPKVSLFALLCELLPVTSLTNHAPLSLRSAAEPTGDESGFRPDPLRLSYLPIDAGNAIAALAIELLALRSVEAGNNAELPLGSVLSSGWRIIGCRNRAAATGFEQGLFMYVEFHEVEDRAELQLSTTKSAGVSPLLVHDVGRRTGGQHSLWEEVLYVSHLIDSYTKRESRGDASRARTAKSPPEVLRSLWTEVLAASCSLGALQNSLGIDDDVLSCPASMVGKALVQLGVVHIPSEMVSRALVATKHGLNAAASMSADDVDVHSEVFDHLAGMCKRVGGGRGASCRDSHVLWAALWSLAHERWYELELIGQLFAQCITDVSTASEEGAHLDYDQFVKFMAAVSPGTSAEKVQELFLSNLDEAAMEMTKDTFLRAVHQHGVSSNVDFLERIAQMQPGSRSQRASEQDFERLLNDS